MKHVWQKRPIVIISLWSALLLGLSAFGLLFGIQSRLPGPGSTQALLENPGERQAITSALPKRDELTLILGHTKLSVEDKEFELARESLVAVLKSYRPNLQDEFLFPRVQTVGHTWLDPELFIAKNRKHLLIRAETNTRIDASAEALRGIPALVLVS